MNQDFAAFHAALAAHDDEAINPSGNRSLDRMVDAGRRNVLKGGLAMAALGFFGGGISACRAVAGDGLLGFKGVPQQFDATFDQVIVAEGYSARPFFSWGDAVLADADRKSVV